MQPKVVAVLGGAFDPIHSDHIRMACECINRNVCSEVWFMPSPDRWDKKPVASAAHRFAMVQRAVTEFESLIASDVELSMGEFRGSYTLFKKLQQNNPGTEFRLIIGSDTYPTIPYWRDSTLADTHYNGDLLLQEFSLILIPRHTTPLPDSAIHTAKGYKPFYVLDTPFVGAISSSEVRRRGISKCRGLVPESVRKYCIDNRLYLSE